MAAKVKRILVALGLVLILEAVSTIRTFVLLLLLVRTKYKIRIYTSFPGGGKLRELFLGVEFLGLLGAALADETSLHLRTTTLCWV
jgi:hypothetical protein